MEVALTLVSSKQLPFRCRNPLLDDIEPHLWAGYVLCAAVSAGVAAVLLRLQVRQLLDLHFDCSNPVFRVLIGIASQG